MKAQVFEIIHTTAYEYQSAVTIAHHLMRLCPRELPRQRRLSYDLVFDPQPSTLHGRRDYFGNETTFATIDRAHRSLAVTARSRVAVSPAFIPDPSETPAWETVRSICRTDRSTSVHDATEFTHASPLVPLDETFAQFAAPSFTPLRPILEAVVDLTRRIHQEFVFDPTATTISTPVATVLKNRRGVCQDFAHLQIACLRSLGLPARYVSGYLESLPIPGQPKLTGADASHAWAAFFCPGIGWLDVDPTNNLLPSMQHVVVGWGRDYADVSPIRGVLLGCGSHQLKVSVDVIPRETIDFEIQSNE